MLRSVPNNLEVPVAAEACIDAGMPLANLSRGVTLLAKLGRPKRTLLWIVCTARVLAFHSHRFDSMLMFARKHSSSRTHPPGATVSLINTRALPTALVDVGRFDPLTGTQGPAHHARTPQSRGR